MKFQALQENLLKAVVLAQRFTSTKAQLPILGNIYLNAQGNSLDVRATNLEMGINVTLGVKVEENGSITIPGKLFFDIIQNLNKGTITISSEGEKITVEADNFNSVIAGTQSSDFPEISKGVKGKVVELEKDLILDSLSKVIYAISQDETRPVLTGVLYVFDDKKSFLVSTDGFRLSRKELGVLKNSITGTYIIPKSTVAELSNMFFENGKLDFAYDSENNQVIFKTENITLSSRVIQGEFPDYNKIIPKSSEVNIKLDKEDFLKAIKLASVFAKDSANVIKLNIKKGSVEVLGESQFTGNQKTTVEANVTGKGFEVAFNFRFILDFLQSVKGENVEIKLNDPNLPVLFLDPEVKDYTHIIMPIRLS